MEIDRETTMPEKWRNRFFKYVAGGDANAGNLWHVAFVLVDKNGTPYYVGNDGAGKIGNLAETLEREFVRHEDVPWDHEFEEYDVRSREKVTELCKSLTTYEDVSVQAVVANMLVRAGYDGAGFTCSDCGEFVESSEYAYFEDDEGDGGFRNCIDRDAYVGCGGIAIAMTRIVCDECRATSECGACWDLNIPVKKGTHEADVERMDFGARFGYDMAGVCEYCWEQFVNKHDRAIKEYHGPGVPETDYEMERIPDDVRICDLLETLEEAEDAKAADPKFAAECWKYFDWKKRVEGLPVGEAFELMKSMVLRDADNLPKLGHGLLRKFVENVVGPVAKAYFGEHDRYLMSQWKPHDLEGEWSGFLELGKENQ